jgi:protease IV
MISNVELITRLWALEPRFHNRMAMAVLAGKLDLSNFPDKKEPYFASATPSASYYYEKQVPKVKSKSGLVAVIPLMGTMSRYGDFCGWGTEDIGGWLLEAYADDSVSAVVLEINSPGGSVDGTELLAAIIGQRNKPVIAYVTGMAASAAYWIASQCDEIIMETAISSEVGSIGVLATHVDASAYYEKEGYKVTIIRAEGSEDKALFNSIEPLSPELFDEVRAEMKPIRERFIEVVNQGRPGIDQSAFGAKMFNGKTAIKMKMADRVGFLGDAVYRADLLARKNSN